GLTRAPAPPNRLFCLKHRHEKFVYGGIGHPADRSHHLRHLARRTIMKLLRKSLPLLTASVLAFSGCGGFGNTNMKGDDSAGAADTSSTADQVSSLSTLTTDNINVSMTGLNNDTAAQVAYNGAGANLTTGCLTKTILGNMVTFTMVNCKGPIYGLA